MNLKARIESILFITGEAVSLKKLEKILEASGEEIRAALAELADDSSARGIILLSKDDEWQFGTHPDNARLVEDVVKSEFTEELSKAALETLAVTVYKQPVSRAEIEFIRGVNSSFSLRNLLMRGLIERIENPKDARSFLYRPSFDFLKTLGLSFVEELPGYAEFRKKAEETLKPLEEAAAAALPPAEAPVEPHNETPAENQ